MKTRYSLIALFILTLTLLTGMVVISTSTKLIAQDTTAIATSSASNADATVPQLREQQNLALKEAPPQIQARIRKEQLYSTLKSLSKGKVNNETVYEAEFEGTTGRQKFQLSEDGAVLRLGMKSTGETIADAAGAERALAYVQRGAPAASQKQLPQAVQGTLQEKLGEIRLEDVQTRQLYDVTFEKDGKRYKAELAEDGKLLGLELAEQAQP